MRPWRWISIACLLLLVMVFGVTAPAGAGTTITLDFEELRIDNEGVNLVGPVYNAEGMTLTALPPPIADFFSVGTLDASFTGSTSLYHHISGNEIVLTRTDDGTFQLLSIDLAELPSGDQFGEPIDFGPFNVTFSGIRKNGRTITATATVSSFPTVTTFVFKGFANLTSIHWFQGAGGGPGLSTHQFDNVVVRIPRPPVQ